MISKKHFAVGLATPLALGLLATPMLARAPDSAQVGRSFVDTSRIELLGPQLAQVGGDEIGGGGGTDDGGSNRRTPPAGPDVPVSDGQTAQIVTQLERIQQICEFMGDEYRLACIATTYRELADDIPANGDYAVARETILNAARELDTLVRSNRDRQKPALRARLRAPSGQSVQTPPIAAVRADRAVQLNRQASNILEEAETVLLRSARSDATRAIHYQRIAAAVGSNKVLLRSS